MTLKVSVVMAVYNAESTIRRMLDSVRCQTMTDFEIIAVDDGSTDRSGSILDEYAQKYPLIHVIHKTNGGVASARQAGVENARGEYIIHADSDDYIEKNMLETMVSQADAENADIVIADYYVDKETGKSLYISQRPESLNTKDILYDIYAKKLFGGLCHKLMRRDLYAKADASFIPGIDYCEDQLLLTQILSRLDLRITYLPQAFYHYVQTDTSLTRKITAKGFENLKRFHNTFPTLLPKEERFQELIPTSSLNLFIVGFCNGLYTNKELKREFKTVKKEAFKAKSIRWLAGYICIYLGLYRIARLLIRY